MTNPFDEIDARLSNIENLILSLKHNSHALHSAEKQEQFLTIQQAAAFLCLTVPTIYSKVSKRELPFMKQGKRLYFAKSELSDYLRRGKKETAAEMEADNYLITKK